MRPPAALNLDQARTSINTGVVALQHRPAGVGIEQAASRRLAVSRPAAATTTACGGRWPWQSRPARKVRPASDPRSLPEQPLFRSTPDRLHSGQTITIDSGPNLETAVVISSTGGGRGGGRGAPAPGASVTVAAPLARSHPAGAPVTGTGITIAGGLTRAHASGVEIGPSVPTPGAPHMYRKRN